MKKVKDHLNEQKYWDIFTVSEDSNLFDAAALMNKNKIGALMICEKGSEDHLSKSSVVGILTERDLVYALSGGSKNLETKTVKDIMTRKLIFTCPETSNSNLTEPSTPSLIALLGYSGAGLETRVTSISVPSSPTYPLSPAKAGTASKNAKTKTER